MVAYKRSMTFLLYGASLGVAYIMGTATTRSEAAIPTPSDTTAEDAAEMAPPDTAPINGTRMSAVQVEIDELRAAILETREELERLKQEGLQ